MGEPIESYERYGVSKQKLGEARVRVEQLCTYAFGLAELLHPGFLAELHKASKQHEQAEHAAVRAAVESAKF